MLAASSPRPRDFSTTTSRQSKYERSLTGSLGSARTGATACRGRGRGEGGEGGRGRERGGEGGGEGMEGEGEGEIRGCC